MTRLDLQPIFQDEAFHFIKQHHRHHLPPVGWIFGIGVNQENFDGVRVVIGVITVGRPVSRKLDELGWVAEVTRCCVAEGHPGAASMLYAAAWRAAKALGYKRLITYTLKSEDGASLRGAGWKCLGDAGGKSWHRESRPRVDKAPTEQKRIWEAA
jgi:hypothetical protein